MVFDHYYDPLVLLRHSLKVFLLSYPDMLDNTVLMNSPAYLERRFEFIQTIYDLYDVALPVNPQEYIDVYQNTLQECLQQNMIILFTFKKVYGRTRAQSIRLFCSNSTTLAPADPLFVELDMTRDEQISKVAMINSTFADIGQMKIHNNLLGITMEGIGWQPDVVNEPSIPFQIEMNRIHGEGYQQWHDFGRGVRVLIEITFKAFPLDLNTPNEKDFHLYTLYRMLWKRANLYQPGTVNWSEHKTKTAFVNFDRPAVIADTAIEFWRGVGATPLHVHHFDLQRGYASGLDMEERVCLCNEWCNWTSFFAHNPIYRFIIVQNSQMCLIYQFNIPDLYVLAAAMVLRNRNLPMTGVVLPLLRSADRYRHHNFSQIISPNQNFMFTYYQCYPDVDNVVGVVYNYIRYQLPVAQYCHQLVTEPTAEVCVKNLIGYYTVLSNLHQRCSYNPNFVKINRRKRWAKEIEKIQHHHLGDFFKKTYEAIFNRNLAQMSSDCLLDSDIEYERFVPKNDEERYMQHMRERALLSKPENEQLNPATHNPLNLRFYVRTFTETFIWVYKFFIQIEPMFPTPRRSQALETVWEYCLALDDDLRAFHNGLTVQEQNSLFVALDHDFLDHGMDTLMASRLKFLYTLKLYSFGFIIQRHCIRIRDKVLNFDIDDGFSKQSQFTDVLEFIADYIAIEQTVRAVPNNNFRLFHVEKNRLQTLFLMFYGTNGFYGKPDYENHNESNPFFEFGLSALTFYNKLWVWIREGGNLRLRFLEIVDHYCFQFVQTIEQCQQLYYSVIEPSIHWLSNSFTHYIETMDLLMLYLIRGLCYCFIVNVFALFHVLIMELDCPHLCRFMRGFSMCKPGWVPFIETMKYVLTLLDNNRTAYLIYDDELERINETFDDTKVMIKNIYKHFYYRLSSNWSTELTLITGEIIGGGLDAQTQDRLAHMMEAQLMFGLAFTCKFNAQFRSTFHILRAKIRQDFAYCTGNEPCLQRFQLCGPVIQQYYADIAAIAQAEPPNCPLWQQHMHHVSSNFRTLQPQDVNLLNLAEADLPLP